MQSLHESILKSVGSGKAKVSEEVVAWIRNTKWFTFKYTHIENNQFVYDADIEAEPAPGNSWKINFVTKKEIPEYKFEIADTYFGGKQHDKLPFNIYSISVNEKAINVEYERFEFHDMNEIVKEVKNEVIFRGCVLDKITSVPKNCKTLRFVYANSLSGQKICRINDEVSDIELDTFEVNFNGLSCNLDKFKKVKINSRFECCPWMVGSPYDAFERGGKLFKKDASDLIWEFFQNNKCEMSHFMFIEEKKKLLGAIKLDKKTGRFRYKPL